MSGEMQESDFPGRPTFEQWAMEECATIARRSRDPSTKVGCVIIRPNKTVVSKGYNGFPRGVHDSPSRYAHRETKYMFTCHAEANAIVTAREPLNDCLLVCTHTPCNECAKLIIQAGIREVWCPTPSEEMVDRWGESFEVTQMMFRESGVKLVWVPGTAVGGEPPVLK